MFLDWHGDEFLRMVQAGAEARLGAAAGYLASRFKIKVGRTQPTRTLPSGRMIGLDPSRPGEPPKVVTGVGRDSIEVAPDGNGGFILAVAGHMALLDQGTRTVLPRPWIVPTLEEEMDNAGQVAAGDVGPLVGEMFG